MSTNSGNNTPRRKNSQSPSSSPKHSPTQSPIQSAHILPTKKDGFLPRPYTFKIKGHEVGPDGAVARMPPYWMLIDHTLAVIWCMCSPQHKHTLLGITQLQWALYMLKSVKTRRGDYTSDVKQLIDAIEDRLLDQYAAIAKHSSAILDGGNKSKSINTTSFHATRLRKERPSAKCFVVQKAQRPSRQGSSAAVSSAPRSTSDAPAAEVGETSPQSDETPNTFVSSVYLYHTAQEEILLSSSPEPDETTSSYHDCTKSSGFDDFQSFVESRNETFLSQSTPGRRPISTEYEEVMKRSPPPSGLRQSTARPTPRILFQDDHDDDDDQKEGERLIGDIRSKLPTTVSKEETMKFLEKMRQDQVKLIRGELTKFQAIEEFMMRIDSNNFHTVLDQSMSRRLEECAGKKLPGEL